MKTDTTPTVSTKDIHAIAALISIGIEPRQLRNDGGRLIADFEASAQVALTDYVMDKIRVSPRAFSALVKDLKGLAGANGSPTGRWR